MSYIPDYRNETDKLNEIDKAIVNGYRCAIDDMKCFFDNLDDDEALSIVKEIAKSLKARLEEWMECEETELVCSLFDNADYLPEDIDLVDANRDLFKND
jgi:hypothetical protein